MKQRHYSGRHLKGNAKAFLLVLCVVVLAVIVVKRCQVETVAASAEVQEAVTVQVEAEAPHVDPTPSPMPEPVKVEVKCINSFPCYQVPLSVELQFFIAKTCEAHHIDPAVVIAMIDLESKFTADILGDGGNAFGLMQIHPRWHQDRMDKLGVTDLLEPFQNVEVGIDFLGELAESGKPIEWVLMAYNGGMQYANEMIAAGKISFYASEVLRISNELKEGEKTAVFITDDPIADFNAWDAEQADWLAKLPVCADCGEPIQDETAFYINGDWICNDCIDSYKRDVLPE